MKKIIFLIGFLFLAGCAKKEEPMLITNEQEIEKESISDESVQKENEPYEVSDYDKKEEPVKENSINPEIKQTIQKEEIQDNIVEEKKSIPSKTEAKPTEIPQEKQTAETKEEITLQSEIPQHEHEFHTVIKEADCTTPKTISRVCDCGAIEDSYTEGNPLGHKMYGDARCSVVAVVIPPTCMAPGTVRVKCARCDYTEDIINYPCAEAVVTNHLEYDEIIEPATCRRGTKHTFVCKLCKLNNPNMTYCDDDKLEHNYVLTTGYNPLIGEEYDYYICADCFAIKEE